ncbi:putative kinesin-related protein bimC [Apodospora peruviana]|uniref:Kinesin-related protein bimC n=1 Tax=Apodospora peruviana TaxID=516989 RepID=A0AAE0IQ53_9PEZI|nr:putative kinesin-related protein bimC [Apodospora peruviana]
MERRNISTLASTLRGGPQKRASVRPPTRNVSTTTARQPYTRRASALPRIDRSGAASPAESLMSVATTATTTGAKRKEREFDADEGEATNINVVVRCRGRNEREVKENSAVVVSTDGVKGKLVNLSMGPNALSNKAYNFDRVFSQAADQAMVFDDVVKPIMDEMLAGYNCTIFAYGQTGTGKTYTMSGDMTETMGLLPDTAGIIPRVLHALFNKLEVDKSDNCVRCSFIELYNEELRDLLSAEEGAKLKIYDDASRKGHSTTVVQGMEERHITNAADGLRWLQEGSLRRQVAATKCNDLSSRSHTVFTITIYVKQMTENGEDFLIAGKLNLVDLAGSENIQRSGAENKRAAEAGLINKSLLTLGRVINALVDRSQHIPYRESKLTRLLQDSLGGRTKTCIIATVSPAKSNLEETISTLDYAFRAKNIRNKPQINALINKKTLLREFTAEIEKLKGELIATRQRNGVYLSNDAYEEITVQNESRRILTEEQAAKIETLEANLRNKLQELLSLTSSFMGLKKEHEGTRMQLDETKEVLDQTELVLAATRKTLAEETHIRKAHQATEEQLSTLGGELLMTIKRTVNDVDGLHAKNRRKSELQSLNRSTWSMSQAQVSSITELVETRMDKFCQSQEEQISSMSQRVQSFVEKEVEQLGLTQAFLENNLARFDDSKIQLLEQKQKSKEEMDDVLEGIKIVRDSVKERVGQSLQAISSAAERIAGDVLSELDTFHSQLHTSYSSLGKDFKTIFEELLRHISAQKAESDKLRRQLEGASRTIVESNESVSTRIQEVLDEERKRSAAERQTLLSQITALVNSQGELQESRLAGKTAIIRQTVQDFNQTFEDNIAQYSNGMDAWGSKDSELLAAVTKTRDTLKTRLKDDWVAANVHSTSVQTTTKSVHAETVRVVDEQIKDLDVQMRDLDDFVSRARSQNAEHHEQHAEAMQNLDDAVEKSFSNISERFADTHNRAHELASAVETDIDDLVQTLVPLEEEVIQPLTGLRRDMQCTVLREYEPTGETPQKMEYQYPTELPRTLSHDILIAGMRDAPTPSKSVPVIFGDEVLDLQPGGGATSPLPRPSSSSNASSGGRPERTTRQRTHSMSTVRSLREVNPNLTTTMVMGFDPTASVMSMPAIDEDENTINHNHTMPLLKRSAGGIVTSGEGGKLTRFSTRKQKSKSVAVADGVENLLPPHVFSQSTGGGSGGGSRRKSPRLN